MMKKKIISCIASVAMLLSLCVANVSAAADFSNTNPVKFDISVDVISNDDYKAVMETDIPDGYGAYVVTIDMSNYGSINGSITKKATGAQGSGDALTDFTVKLKAADSSCIYSESGAYYILDMGSQFTFTTIGYADGYFNLNAQAGSAIEAFPLNTLTPPTVMNKTVQTGDMEEKIEALGYLWFVAKPGTQFSVITNGKFQTYTNNSVDSSLDKGFYTATGYDGVSAEAKGTAVITETITLGTSAPVVEDKPVTMDTPVAGNNMYGMKTALTEITFKNVADPVVKLEKDGVDSGKTYELPAGVKGGETAIIGIIRYAADVTGTFVLKVLDGTTEVASTTYEAKKAE